MDAECPSKNNFYVIIKTFCYNIDIIVATEYILSIKGAEFENCNRRIWQDGKDDP